MKQCLSLQDKIFRKVNGDIMSKLLILGAGGHGKVVVEIASLMEQWDEIAFLDDNTELKVVNGYPVIGRLTEYKTLRGIYNDAFVAVGNNKLRIVLLNQLIQEDLCIPTLIHPSATLSTTSQIGQGTVIMPGVVVNSNVEIGMGCIINTSSSIDHDCIIENGVHISPGVHIGGTTRVEQNAWICIGASIANNVLIGKNSTIAAGSAVVKDVEANSLVGGTPAKFIKKLA